MSIAENVAAVRARMEAAAGGRRVLLVAASKMTSSPFRPEASAARAIRARMSARFSSTARHRAMRSSDNFSVI